MTSHFIPDINAASTASPNKILRVLTFVFIKQFYFIILIRKLQATKYQTVLQNQSLLQNIEGQEYSQLRIGKYMAESSHRHFGSAWMTYGYVITTIIVNNGLESVGEEKVLSFFKASSQQLSRGTEEYFEKSLRISILWGQDSSSGLPRRKEC